MLLAATVEINKVNTRFPRVRGLGFKESATLNSVNDAP